MENNKDLREVVKEYMETSDKSINDIANETGYARPTLSRYINGKYESDATAIEDRLRGYIARETGREFTVVPEEKPKKIAPKIKTDFFESRDAKNVLGVCSSSQEFEGLGIVVGKSGYGKTYALTYYARMPKVAYIECDAVMSVGDLLDSIEDALGLPSRHVSARKRMKFIDEFCKINRGYLIIVDEADKLISKYSQNKMELIRWIFDQHHVGIVLAGEPKLEVLLKTYAERLANRVDFYALLSGLDKREVDTYLEDCNVNDNALPELRNRACNKVNGCFRLFDRTLKNAFRILEERGEDEITEGVITQASGMMML